MTDLDQVMSVRCFVERYPDLGKSAKAIYTDIERSEENGLHDCGAILRKGRRVWIVVPRYRDWLFSQHV